MGNVKVVNSLDSMNIKKDNTKPKKNKKRMIQHAIRRSCVLADFFMKQAQIIFCIYIIFFDTDIVEFSLRYIDTEKYSFVPNVERIWIYFATAVVFLISMRGLRKTRKLLTLFLRNRKQLDKVVLPDAMPSYVKEARLQSIAIILTLMLNGVMNYWNGMNMQETILSWYYCITVFFYFLCHMLQGIVIISKRRKMR